MNAVLEVEGVRHRYGSTVALDGVDLVVAPGECVALLGPNGAGKATLVNLVTGLARRQQGTVRVVGGDPARAATRQHLGVGRSSTAGFPPPTVTELLRGAAVRAGAPLMTVGPVLAEVGLAELRRRRGSPSSPESSSNGCSWRWRS